MRAQRWAALAAATPAVGDVSAASDDLLDLVPELTPTKTTPQNPVHHGEGDVFTHTKMVIRELVSGAAYAAAAPDDRTVLFLAALLHDIAKPSTTVIDPDGRIRQPGHSRRGAIDIRSLLWRSGAPFGARERIASVVLHHQEPFMGISERRGVSGEARIRRMSWETRLDDLIAVARADIRGRIASDIRRIEGEIDLFELQAMEMDCLTKPCTFPDGDTRFAYLRRDGAIAAEYPFFEAAGPVVTFVCGMAGSGKDHWLKSNYDGPEVAFDDVRESMDLSHGDAEGQVAQATIGRVREYLRAGQSFAWNATALQKTFRDARVNLVRDYGARVRVVHVEAADEQTWRRQNAERARSVPDSYLAKSLQRWELPLPSDFHEAAYIQQGVLQQHPIHRG